MFQIGKEEGRVECYCSNFEVLIAAWLRVNGVLGSDVGLMVPDVL